MKIFYHEPEPSVLPRTNTNNCLQASENIADDEFVRLVWFVVKENRR